MKMAKPSARDIEAAEELHQVLQMLDARFGGPFQNHEAGDDLAMLLDNGDNAFDSYNLQHLQTLYNHLARLLRNAPNFYGRVIGGMCWVIMNEANQILDPESDCIDLHPRFQQMAAECERLRGLMPEMPPRPPEGSGLPRYGLRWNGPSQPITVPMDDGYWTPWHLAAQGEQFPPCDYCGTIPDHHPWHGSGPLNGVESPHIHACNDCRHMLPSSQSAQQGGAK